MKKKIVLMLCLGLAMSALSGCGGKKGVDTMPDELASWLTEPVDVTQFTDPDAVSVLDDVSQDDTVSDPSIDDDPVIRFPDELDPGFAVAVDYEDYVSSLTDLSVFGSGAVRDYAKESVDFTVGGETWTFSADMSQDDVDEVFAFADPEQSYISHGADGGRWDYSLDAWNCTVRSSESGLSKVQVLRWAEDVESYGSAAIDGLSIDSSLDDIIACYGVPDHAFVDREAGGDYVTYVWDWTEGSGQFDAKFVLDDGAYGPCMHTFCLTWVFPGGEKITY